MRLCTLESYSPLPSICLLLHSDGLSRDRDYPSEYALITKKWMQFLLQYDYSLEHRDKYGRTPLLDYSYRTGGRQAIETIRLLLEFGANTQAVDIFGQNAIHCAMFADNEHSDILEEKFNLLIKGGVDIHQREYGGWTPSRLARALGCWETWCKALERNGLEIRDILQQHGELWLLDEWSEDDDTQDDNSNKGRQDEVESDEEASE